MPTKRLSGSSNSKLWILIKIQVPKIKDANEIKLEERIILADWISDFQFVWKELRLLWVSG